MKSHEIKLLECTPGLGSTGTNRRAFAEPSLGHTGLASDPEQLPSRQGLRVGMPSPGPSLLRSRQARWKNTAPTLGGVATPAVNVFWRVGLSEAPVSLLSVFRVTFPVVCTSSKPFLDPLSDVEAECKSFLSLMRLKP